MIHFIAICFGFTVGSALNAAFDNLNIQTLTACLIGAVIGDLVGHYLVKKRLV